MKSSKILTTFFLAALASAAACGSDEPTKSNLARLETASEDELDLWTERILTAETLSELFA